MPTTFTNSVDQLVRVLGFFGQMPYRALRVFWAVLHFENEFEGEAFEYGKGWASVHEMEDRFHDVYVRNLSVFGGDLNTLEICREDSGSLIRTEDFMALIRITANIRRSPGYDIPDQLIVRAIYQAVKIVGPDPNDFRAREYVNAMLHLLAHSYKTLTATNNRESVQVSESKGKVGKGLLSIKRSVIDGSEKEFLEAVDWQTLVRFAVAKSERELYNDGSREPLTSTEMSLQEGALVSLQRIFTTKEYVGDSSPTWFQLAQLIWPTVVDPVDNMTLKEGLGIAHKILDRVYESGDRASLSQIEFAEFTRNDPHSQFLVQVIREIQRALRDTATAQS